MSFNINSDKEFVRGSKPRLIGDDELTIRSGTGSAEKEILRAQLDGNTALPRVGINRTGERVNVITIVSGGSGYTTEPSVTIDSPSTAGGVQALASAFIFNGQVVNIAINNPGSGYTTAPGVTITGGNGGGASATSVLDTVDFELDINGAIRTSTSIISDTARILNLDIDNFITPDTNFRAPNLKTFMNNTGTEWGANVIVQKDAYRYFGSNVYQAINAGQTGAEAPTHIDGTTLNGAVNFKHIGFRANDANSFKYNETGDAGIFPRSITPLLGDRSDKIATTEYVLNLATNDVGGRIYVSQTIGSDLNDGRSAVNPVRTIKRAAQLAWATPGVKETLIVSGGEYVEDNPISLPPDASVVGDNLRLVIIRPANAGKHIFKFGDKNYVIGVTYRDQVDSIGDAVATWDFAMVFDDKQRIIIDNEVNGDFGVNFPIGHQIFGPDQFRVNFQENTGLSSLVSGLEVVGINTGARAKLIDVVFNQTTGVDAYLTGTVDVQLTSGSFLEGERFNYIVSGTQGSSIAITITSTQGENVFRTTTDPDTLIPPGTYIYLDDTDDSSFTQGFYEVKTINDDNSPTYWDVEVVPILNSPGWKTTATETININAANITVNQFDTTTLKSIRAEGEVVSFDDDITSSVPIQRLDFSLQGDPSIATGGFQNAQFGNAEDLGGVVFYTNELVGRSNIHEFKEGQEILIEGLPTSSPDLSVLNGKQRIYKVLEDADGRSRRFVIPKKLPAITDANFDPGTTSTAKSFSKSVTLSLLNTPNSFPLSTPVERRFQDACVFIRNNREFIADEVVGQINEEFKTDHFRVYDIGAGGGDDFKIYLGASDHPNTYVSGGTVTFGGSTYTITNFVYDNAVTGTATVTTSAAIPALAEDDVVKLADILISCSAGNKIYPAYSSPTSGSNTGTDGDEQCRQDVIHFVNAIVRDLEFGSNHNIIDAAKKYIVNDKIAFIEDEIIQNVRAVEYARRLCILAMRNWRMEDGTTNDPVYVPRYSSVPRYFDDTVITTTAGTPACADVKAAIDTLAFLWGDVITNNSSGTYLDGAYLISRNADLIADQAFQDTLVAFPEIAYTNINERKCPRDTKLILKYLVRDLVLGGNSGIVTAAESYFSDSTLTGVSVSEIPYVRYAYTRARLYAKYASKNWSATGSTGGTGGAHLWAGGTASNAVQSGGDYAHTFVSGTVTSNAGALPNPITNIVYTAANGDMVITSAGHGLSTANTISIADNALSFTCTMDGNTSTKTYPRSTDPASGSTLAISAVTTDTFTINVGSSPIVNHDVTNATYDPATGVLVLTIGNHSLPVNTSIQIAANSLTFTCDKDGNATQHTYPRVTDPYYNTAINIDATTTNTITVNVGVSPTTSGVTTRSISDATYTPTTGVLSVSMTASSIPTGFGQNATSRVAFQLGGIVFSCAYSGGGNDESPKIFDQNVGKSFEVLSYNEAAGVATFTMNVGVAGSNTDTHTFVSGSAILITDYVAMSSPVPKFEDWSILIDDGNGSTCNNVDSSINTSFELLDDILKYSVDPSNGTEPGSTTKTYGTLYDTNEILTYPNNFIYDQNNTRMAIRADYDDFPIVEASPYTQNSSVISFLGGGGALVDGSKVKAPNCPFPGLELDGTASFPNQGKSMVASAFTIVSFGGTGYKVINDGYTQLVSVFVIFCADGVLCESGGYASITNSATNFGIYALRGIGFRAECYSFDVGTISNISSTPTGRTILTVTGLGREPLEHYIVKVDGFRNTNTDIEFFVDAVSGVTVGPPFSAQLTIDNGTGDALDLTNTTSGSVVSPGSLTGETIKLHRPSIVNSSSHTWEFAGSGTNYLALPENGGTKTEAFEQVSEQYGRVYVSGTDELGDFKVGTFARIENRTGAITFTGTVTISEVEFLKLKGGDVVVTGFDASNTLGGANSSDSKLPTQKAVKDYITNNLGPYINKPFSTNAIPRNLVELTDSGKISVDQIPALRPFEVFTVANQSERLALEGALAGDIAIEQDTSTSFILNNDLDSQFLGFGVDTTLQFTIGDIFTGSITGARLQATEYRQGVVFQINISQGGSGYASPPTVTLTGGTPQAGSIEAKATCIIANGEVVAIDLITFNGFKGGKGYTVAPTVNIAAPSGSGVAATATSLIESRLYGDIVNRIKMADNDFIESSDIPAVDIDITRVVNTSSSNSLNWVSLSSNTLSANQIVSGVIETDRLASGGAANSFTFLRGDQNFALAVQSVKGSERRYFAKLTSQCNSGSSEMVFATLSDALVGHEIKNNVSGVQPNTNITGVLTTGGSTTIGLNNPVVATITAGTVIEFERGDSPMIFESTYTQGNFVDDVIISNGGTGFTNGQYFDLGITGGTGTGAKFNVTISGGAITELTVTDGGSGYDADFTMTVPPTEIGGGSGLVLLVKISTVNRQYANVALDVQRVSDLTISSDLYGTIGVARFKKSQFNIGVSGNGSVDLNVGADSGLDADLLDGQQGEYYTNATNLFSGSVPTDRLSGSYNISVSGSSGNTLRLATGTNNPTSNPSPDNFAGGIVSNTINNSANGLSDGGTKNLVITLRAGGTSFDASFGGIRQLAFTDNDNMYLRGSGTGVTTFGSWAKIWSSLNDGIGSELDADRLDNRQGIWYQNALNINYGTLSDNRLPTFMSAKVVQNDLTIKAFNGDPKYRIYISGLILNTTPFTPGANVNLYDANSQGTGTIAIDNIIVNNEADNTNDYTIIIGRLTTGNFIGAKTIGTAANRKEFQDFTLEDGNTIQVAKLESDGGTANLRLGRKDSIASSPGVYFNSSVSAANYNVGLVATGGNATDGSGTLNCLVANADGFNVNGNVVWNAGNIEFQSANIANSGVKRDASGNFSAGTITATLTGSASLNVLKAGDSMSGSLNITGTGSTLGVSGDATFNSKATVTDDFAVDTDALFVDASNDSVGINVGTTLEAGVGLEVKGGSTAALRIQGGGSGINGTNHMLLLDVRDNYYDNASHAMMFLTSGTGSSITPGEGAHWIFNGRAEDRDFIFRNNSSNKLTISGQGGLKIENSGTQYAIEADKKVLFREGVFLDSGNDNSGTFITMFGALNYRSFRISQQTTGNDLFAIQASNSDGNNDWNTTPALQIKGDTNAVAINTTAHSGTDPSTSTVRQYKLNVQGDVNFNGQLFQNNAEFVTSRWTEASNGTDIFRLSKVGINQSDPSYTLEVNGETNLKSTLRVNGDAQYLDTYGIVKRNRNSISQNLTIGGADNAASYGPVAVASGYTVTISSGGVWNIL